MRNVGLFSFVRLKLIVSQAKLRTFPKQFVRSPGAANLHAAVIECPATVQSLTGQQTGKLAQECLLGSSDAVRDLVGRHILGTKTRFEPIVFLGLGNYPKTLSSSGFYGGYTPFSDSYLSRT